MSRKLIVTDGTRQRELQLVGRIVVGRDPTCDVTHEHSLLSRRHAEFVTAGDLVVVRDLGSRNGVFVNGAKAAEHSLRPGDIVQIGPLRAEYVLDAAPLSIAPEDHDADRTTVRRAVSAPAAAEKPAAAAPAPRSVEIEDDEATRLISARRPEPEQRPPTPAAVSGRPVTEPVDDDETRFIPSRQPARALSDESTDEGQPVFVETPAARPSFVEAPQAGVVSLRGYIFRQVLLLGALVLTASALSLRLQGAVAPLTAFVVPAFVAIVGGYLVSGVIDRRFIHTAGRRDQD